MSANDSPLWLLSDAATFTILQLALGLVFLYALWRDVLRARARRFARRVMGRWRSEASLAVGRGERSRARFHFAYALASVVLLQLIDGTSVYQGYKTAFSLADLGAVAYLAYFSTWGRNKILAWATSWEEMKERG